MATIISNPHGQYAYLRKHGSNVMDDPIVYTLAVEALQYVTLTRPGISFSVNKVCEFFFFPLKSRWKYVKCILRYIYKAHSLWHFDSSCLS